MFCDLPLLRLVSNTIAVVSRVTCFTKLLSSVLIAVRAFNKVVEERILRSGSALFEPRLTIALVVYSCRRDAHWEMDQYRLGSAKDR